MVEDCPMTEECPAYDRDRRMCLVRPGDCELFAPTVAGEAALTFEAPPGADARPTRRSRVGGAARRLTMMRSR